MDSLPLMCTVQAEYSFKGSNNDELCFKKGDIITVTQKEDGGWWEGTLLDKTGWFPSNYVKEYKVPLSLVDTIRAPEEIQAFRSVVYNDLLDSERAHVAELRGMVENFLEPLETSQILTLDEYAQLMCNFIEIVECHEDLYTRLEECSNDRVGKIFLSKAPIMKKVHQQYCALHPRAIVIVDKYKDELNTFMERQGAAKPGLLVLTTGLSKPFRRLDKYSAILQELERHMETCHPDRGDTQRSIAVYKDLAASCSATRRQKELELQILTGPVRGWQGQELSSLGEIIHMGSVAVGPDHRDRYFVLFPQTLLILSVSQRMSAFKYEGQLPISGITVTRLEDSDQMKNAFEIMGPMIEKIVAVCQGPSDANKWVDYLTNNGGTLTKTVDVLQRQRSGFELKRNASTSSAVAIPQPPPHMSPPILGTSQPTRSTVSMQQISQHKRSLSFNHHLSYNQVQQQQQQIQVRNQQLENQKMTRDPKQLGPGLRSGPKKANWNITNLRQAPPLRPNLLTTTSSTNANTSVQQLQSSPALLLSKKQQPTYEEDALVLRVIEAYCAAYQNTSRNTIHSALQPWTPCLPIRGGKLKTSKHFSTSNPQLPFMCSSISSYLNINNNQPPPQNNSTSSLNSSHIWREASPNNFNMYGSSVSSLNTTYRSRYSIGGCVSGRSGDRSEGGGVGCAGKDWRSVSEEKPQPMNGKFMGSPQMGGNKTGSNYDNIYMNVTTPLLGTRKNKQGKMWKMSTISNRSSPSHTQIGKPCVVDETRSASSSPSPGPSSADARNSLYDRRLNRSFETSSQAGSGNPFTLGGCINKNSKTSPMRRSTPLLMRDDVDMKEETNGSNRIDNDEKTPTLRQIWLSVRQLQQDMVQVKSQISEERALRGHLQQLLISHLDGTSNSKC